MFVFDINKFGRLIKDKFRYMHLVLFCIHNEANVPYIKFNMTFL